MVQVSLFIITLSTIAQVLAAPTPADDSTITLVRRATYEIAGCGSKGGQLPSYCNGGGDNDCRCSSIGVYGCKNTAATSTCQSKGCGCAKPRPRTPPPQPVPQPQPANAQVRARSFDDDDTILVRRATYEIAGCGSRGSQLPSYCNGGGDNDCRCSSIGVYGCKNTAATSTCQSKGCGCVKPRPPTPPPQPVPQPQPANAQVRARSFDDDSTILVRRATYEIAGCGSRGSQLPSYCNGGGDNDCKCSSIGVYGCKNTAATSTCQSKGCGCAKPRPPTPPPQPVPQPARARA